MRESTSIRFFRKLAIRLTVVLPLVAGSSVVSIVKAPTALSAPSVPSVLVLYDTSGTFGQIGELYATYAANLTGHFGTFRAHPVGSYSPGELAGYTAAIYVGSTYNELIPAAFMNDMMNGSTPVVWLGYNIWEPMQLDYNKFVGRYGFASPALDTNTIASIQYKTSTLTRSLDNVGGIMTFGTFDATKVATVATAVRADGVRLPWAVRAANLTYFTELPFPFAQETDRVHVFEDVLFDVLAPCTPTRHRAMIRLEDILPNDDPKRIRDIADYLSSQGVPFGMNVTSQFNDPLGVLTKAGTVIHLKDQKDMVRALQYAQSKGGVVMMHGYTHQYSNVPNPYNGLSADDGEFFIFTVNADNTLNYIRPVPEDSTSWVAGRVAAAEKEFRDAKLSVPTLWTTPHYGASALDLQYFSSHFAARWERSLYFQGSLSGGTVDGTKYIGMYYPYRARDIYGGKILPENSGSYETEAPIHTVADIHAAARANLVVRDGIAGMFYHPFQGLAPLQQIVSGIKSMGYTFVSPTTVANESYGPYAPCLAPTVTATGGNGRIDLAWTLPTDGGATISSTKVYRGTSPGSETLYATLGNVTSYADTAVTNGTTYYYKVSAQNSVGSSPLSSEVTATATPAPVLTAEAGYQFIRLSWTIPQTSPAPTGYNIYRGLSSGTETLLAANAGPPPYEDTGLTNGTTYYYYVRAVTSAGLGPPSNEVSAAPIAPLTPGAPVLSRTVGSGVVHLTWTVPSGSNLWGYKVYRGTTSGGETIYAWPGLVTSYDDTSVNGGATYYYKVSAVNAGGEGPLSNEVSATMAAATVPGAPNLFVSSGPGIVHLSWSTPSNGGSPLWGYKVYRSTSSGTETIYAWPGNVNQYDDASVSKGTTYYYKVSAVNAIGEGPLSNEGSAGPS